MVDRLAPDYRIGLTGEALNDYNLLVLQTAENNDQPVSKDEVETKHPAAAEAYLKLVLELRSQIRTLLPC